MSDNNLYGPYRDAGQRKVAEKRTAQAITNLTGATPEQLRTGLAQFGRAIQQTQLQRPRQANPPAPAIFDISTASLDPQPLTLGQSSNDIGAQAPPGDGGGASSAQLGQWIILTQTTAGPIFQWGISVDCILFNSDAAGDTLDITGALGSRPPVSSTDSSWITQSQTANAIMYLEVKFATGSGGWPNVTSSTVKTFAGTSLPGPAQEYSVQTIGGNSANVQTYARYVLGLSYQNGSGVQPTVIPNGGTTLQLIQGAFMCYDSSNANELTISASKIIPGSGTP
jgi:hypothetical protein